MKSFPHKTVVMMGTQVDKKQVGFVKALLRLNSKPIHECMNDAILTESFLGLNKI
jgi:hypothetical protein